MISTIAFDCFGTVFDMSQVDHEDLKYYGATLRKEIWEPLKFPKSWETLPAHPDCKEGIELLKTKFTVVTCSNSPLGLLTKMSKHNSISWDAIIPLEYNKVYKPNPKAYLTVCEMLNIKPEEMMMVTANPTFGDVEASQKLGMTPQIIRHDPHPKNIIELAKLLLG